MTCRKEFRRESKTILIIILLIIFSGRVFAERIVTDMFGRKVQIPDRVERVISTTPVITIMVYMIAPDTLLGWNFHPNGNLMDNRYLRLPVIGGWFGKKTGNYETFLSMKPDILLEGYSNLGETNRNMLDESQRKMGSVPVIGIKDAANILKYQETISFLGEILGRKGEAKELIDFYMKTIGIIEKELGSIPEKKRVRVYYAEGSDGLFTDPKGSVHSELIEFCQGKNVATVSSKEGFGRIKVSMEQVLTWNPEIIITVDRNFYNGVKKDNRWAGIDAIKNGKVYLAPREPFGWFDRPAGINRIPGILWTAYRLYPDHINKVMVKKLIKDFYLRFYHFNLNKNQLEIFFN